jgi:hypothetical protein
MVGTRTLRGISASPLRGGVRRSGWRRSVGMREPRSRQPQSRCAREGGSMEAGRMITRLMTSESSSKNAGHNVGYQPTLPIPLSLRLPSAEGVQRLWMPSSISTLTARCESRVRLPGWPGHFKPLGKDFNRAIVFLILNETGKGVFLAARRSRVHLFPFNSRARR